MYLSIHLWYFPDVINLHKVTFIGSLCTFYLHEKLIYFSGAASTPSGDTFSSLRSALTTNPGLSSIQFLTPLPQLPFVPPFASTPLPVAIPPIAAASPPDSLICFFF